MMPSASVRWGRVALALTVPLVAASCGGGSRRIATSAPPSPAVAEAQDARSQLEGEWTLTSLQMADGSTRRVVGYLRYDRFATLSVHAELAADEPTLRPPRAVLADFTTKAAPSAGEFEFTGLQEGVPPERLTPDAVSMGEWRYFEVEGNTLRLFVKDRGGRPAATLMFERR
jgi:hypothetical protein